nr:MAG TPA: structural protein [Caudoviricetes sp.]
MAYPYDNGQTPGGLLGMWGGVQPAQKNVSMADVVSDNPGFLAGVTALSMLANNNGRRSFGQLLGRGGLDALGALGNAGMYGLQRDRVATQDALARAQWEAAQQDRAFNRQIALTNLALTRSMALGKMQRDQENAARQADFNAALTGAGGMRPSPYGAAMIPDGSDPYSIAAQSESGGNPWAVSPDRGGSTSYGRYQFNTLPGNSMWQFLGYLQHSNPGLYQALGGGAVQPGTPAFNRAWEAASKSSLGGQMADAQNTFFRQQFVEPALSRLKGSGMDAFAQNPAFIQMLASTAAQHGVGGAVRLLNSAWKGVDKTQTPEAQLEALVRGTYAGRANPGEFVNQLKEDPGFMAKLRPRFEREQGQILGMLRQPQSSGQSGPSDDLGSLDARIQQITALIANAPDAESRQRAESVLGTLRDRRNAIVAGANRKDDIARKAEADLFDQGNRLRKDYMTDIKDYRTYGQNLSNLLSYARQGNGVSDVALLYAFNKMLDPTSVVREGEFRNAQSTEGLPTQVANYLQQIRSGERLSPSQRADIVRTGLAVFAEREKEQRGIEAYYRNIMTGLGIAPKTIDGLIYTPFRDLDGEVNAYLQSAGNADTQKAGRQGAAPARDASGKRAADMSNDELRRQLGL